MGRKKNPRPTFWTLAGQSSKTGSVYCIVSILSESFGFLQ